MKEVIAAAQGSTNLFFVALYGKSHLERNLWLPFKRLRRQSLSNCQCCGICDGNRAQGNNCIARRGFRRKEEIGGRIVNPLDSVDIAEVSLDVGFDVGCV